ncbi:RNA-binding protein [Halobacillus salinus]|uniref:RNA-binding protein n=1 Tax=Halobacillus salinus TaxID=192814 RepID=A0A4Z0H6S2_9BACI|nr:RNA-binding protein [Halobacillus salinus]TGB05494.1 RNA-binding protein [Halobacillus salinus]
MEIYQHFRKEEHPFIDQVLAWRDDVEMRYQRKLTDFLNPREQLILQTIMGNNPDLVYGFSGGAEGAERKRAIIAPEYEIIEQDDFQLTLLEATYADKFITLEHRDVLGAFMSLGVKREKLGDLVVQDGVVHIVAGAEISDFIKMNLTGIKKANVDFIEKPMAELMESKETWSTKETTVSSLRLDVLTKEIYGMSRKKARMHVEAGHVKVNHRVVEDTSFLLEEGDLISLKGKGRSRLEEVRGQTKKDKFRVTTSTLN